MPTSDVTIVFSRSEAEDLARFLEVGNYYVCGDAPVAKPDVIDGLAAKVRAAIPTTTEQTGHPNP